MPFRFHFPRHFRSLSALTLAAGAAAGGPALLIAASAAPPARPKSAGAPEASALHPEPRMNRNARDRGERREARGPGTDGRNLASSAHGLLAKRCLQCHGASRMSGLDLRTRESAL